MDFEYIRPSSTKEVAPILCVEAWDEANVLVETEPNESVTD